MAPNEEKILRNMVVLFTQLRFHTRSVLSLLFIFAYEEVDIFHTSTFFFSAKFYMDQILSNLAAD